MPMATGLATRRRLHRGAADDMPTFATRFLQGRMEGFSKDMRICLTGTPSPVGAGQTHAYFPALSTCCGTLEYLGGLYAGRLSGVGKNEVATYARDFMDQPDYDREAIRILFEAFRNSVNHRGIASGIWVDMHPQHRGRRITWNVHADAHRPALELVEMPGLIRYDSPWDCGYTHRMKIRLGRLWRDIHASVDNYVDAIAGDATQRLSTNFERCMRELYPA